MPTLECGSSRQFDDPTLEIGATATMPLASTRDHLFAEESALSGHEQESLVVDVWTVGGDRQEELLDGLLKLIERFRSSEGFVEARVLKGSRGTAVLSYLRMRSAADLQRLEQDPESQAGLKELQGIARPHRDFYDIAWVFTSPAEHEPASTSSGAF